MKHSFSDRFELTFYNSKTCRLITLWNLSHKVCTESTLGRYSLRALKKFILAWVVLGVSKGVMVRSRYPKPQILHNGHSWHTWPSSGGPGLPNFTRFLLHVSVIFVSGRTLVSSTGSNINVMKIRRGSRTLSWYRGKRSYSSRKYVRRLFPFGSFRCNSRCRIHPLVYWWSSVRVWSRTKRINPEDSIYLKD